MLTLLRLKEIIITGSSCFLETYCVSLYEEYGYANISYIKVLIYYV